MDRGIYEGRDSGEYFGIGGRRGVFVFYWCRELRLDFWG